jgi:hypothetical protein
VGCHAIAEDGHCVLPCRRTRDRRRARASARDLSTKKFFQNCGRQRKSAPPAGDLSTEDELRSARPRLAFKAADLFADGPVGKVGDTYLVRSKLPPLRSIGMGRYWRLPVSGTYRLVIYAEDFSAIKIHRAYIPCIYPTHGENFFVSFELSVFQPLDAEPLDISIGRFFFAINANTIAKYFVKRLH